MALILDPSYDLVQNKGGLIHCTLLCCVCMYIGLTVNHFHNLCMDDWN